MKGIESMGIKLQHVTGRVIIFVSTRILPHQLMQIRVLMDDLMYMLSGTFSS